MNILGFIEKAEWVIASGMGDHGRECLECEGNEPNHKPDCELKAAIDGLKSGRLVVLPRITLSEIAVDLDMDAEQLLEWIKERGE